MSSGTLYISIQPKTGVRPIEGGRIKEWEHNLIFSVSFWRPTFHELLFDVVEYDPDKLLLLFNSRRSLIQCGNGATRLVTCDVEESMRQWQLYTVHSLKRSHH